MANAQAGQPWVLVLEFYDEQSGALTDPDGVTLDITYGSEVGFVPDTGGPFTYTGSPVPAQSQVYRTGIGQYAYVWQVPDNALQGVYVANWSVLYEGDTYLVVEDFPVLGGGVPIPVPGGDIGYWTGGLIYLAAGLDIEFGTVDSNGITWLWQKIEGWDGPDVSGGVIQRAGDQGAWPSPQWLQARTITLTATASAPTQALRDLAREILQQAVPISDLAVLRYDEPVPKQAFVRRSGKVTEKYPTLTDVTFTIPLVAPDPRKYGITSFQEYAVAPGPPVAGLLTIPFTAPFTLTSSAPGGSGASVACTNAGNFETRPTVGVEGPIISPAITNTTTAQTVSYTGLTLGPNDVLLLDFSLRQATLNGTYVPADAFSQWWTLPPGTSTIALSGLENSGATMLVEWAPAFL